MLNKLKRFFHVIKSIMLYKHDVGYMWAIKVCGLIAIVILIYLVGVYIVPSVTGLVVLYLLFKSDSNSPEPTVSNVNADCFIAGSLLFDVLKQHEVQYYLLALNNVNDIVPTLYPVRQVICGLEFYKFVVLKEPDETINYANMVKQLNIYICQKLQAGYPNMPRYFYYDLPYFCVFSIEPDNTHQGYIGISVMPVRNDNAYNYIKQLMEHNIRNSHMKASKPIDKDF